MLLTLESLYFPGNAPTPGDAPGFGGYGTVAYGGDEYGGEPFGIPSGLAGLVATAGISGLVRPTSLAGLVNPQSLYVTAADEYGTGGYGTVRYGGEVDTAGPGLVKV